MATFWDQVRTLRWDDHRYYHQCRISQTLHLISAISFLVAYGLLFIDPAAAAWVGWLWPAAIASVTACSRAGR